MNKGSELSTLIQELGPAQLMKQAFHFFYEGQTPNVAVFLVKGEARLVEAGQETKLSAPILLGVKEFIHHIEMDCSLIVDAGALVSVIDRAGVSKLLAQSTELANFVNTP